MTLTKTHIKILKTIYKKHYVDYKSLQNKFHKYNDFTNMLECLIRNNYIIQIGGSTNCYGEPISFTDETLFKIDSLGSAEVEQTQWFNTEYIVSHILIPIVLAVISTLITLFLTNSPLWIVRFMCERITVSSCFTPPFLISTIISGCSITDSLNH